MLTVTQKRLTACLFDSVAEPFDFVKLDWKKSENKSHAERSLTGISRVPSETWLGAPNADEMYRRLKEGWPDGSRRLLEIATRDINPTSVRRRRERADQGAELDIHAVYRGDLSRAWMRTRRRSGSGVRSVTIVINLAANWRTTSEQLFWRGAAALRLAASLTEAGYSVAIVGATGGRNVDSRDKMDLVQCVSIKDEDQPLDLDKLAALTAMPGYFRTALFAGICYHADLRGFTVADNLGEAAAGLIKDGIAMLPLPQSAFIQGDINDKATAEKWIDSVLNSIETPELEAA